MKSIAFFSGVDVDKCLRKEPDLDFISPSNPNGLSKGYGIQKGFLNIFIFLRFNIKKKEFLKMYYKIKKKENV